jgi:hypothetical protein
MGAMHPVLFMLMVYAISVVLAFFVCNVIYNSIHSTALGTKNVNAATGFTAMK